jgi:hypothetical protein
MKFQSTISAIGCSIVQDRCPRCDSGGELFQEWVVRFLLEQHGRMATYLQWAFRVLTFIFEWSSVLRHGRRFHRLPHSKRRSQIEKWRNSRLPLCGDFIRFFDIWVTFFWFSETNRAVCQDRDSVGASSARPAA